MAPRLEPAPEAITTRRPVTASCEFQHGPGVLLPSDGRSPGPVRTRLASMCGREPITTARWPCPTQGRRARFVDHGHQADAHVPHPERLGVVEASPVHQRHERLGHRPRAQLDPGAQWSGSTLGRLSKNPPPVMWASAIGRTPASENPSITGR